MNQILAERPRLDPDHRVHGRLPRWLARTLQAACVALGIGAVVVAHRQPGATPIAVVAALDALAVLLAALAWHPALARDAALFLADRHGLYFPDAAQRRWRLGRGTERWLAVPWRNVARIAVEPVVVGEHGSAPGLLVTLRINEAQAADFFAPGLGAPTLQRTIDGLFSIGYPAGFGSPDALATALRTISDHGQA